MKISVIILAVVSLLTWAHAKPTQKGGRKPAETHGGVVTSNQQFEAAVKFALNEGSDLMRIISVKKRIDCITGEAAYFEVVYGSQNSQTGKESTEKSAQILRVPSKKEYLPSREMEPDSTAFVAQNYSGRDCQ